MSPERISAKATLGLVQILLRLWESSICKFRSPGEVTKALGLLRFRLDLVDVLLKATNLVNNLLLLTPLSHQDFRALLQIFHLLQHLFQPH